MSDEDEEGIVKMHSGLCAEHAQLTSLQAGDCALEGY